MTTERKHFFGRALADDGTTYDYIIHGASRDNAYWLALEATNNTQQGTYVASISLEALHNAWTNTGACPSTLDGVLKWVEDTFDDGHGTVEWSTAGGTPQLVGTHDVGLEGGSFKQRISFPPSETPMVGNLTQAQADAVRKHITDLVFATFLTTRRKLGECELQKKKFTRAMQQELLQAEGRKAADILAMIENIGNGGEPPAPQEIGQAATAEASQRDSQAPAEAAPPAHVGQARIVRGRGPRGRGGRRGNPLAIRPVGGTAKK